MRRGRPIRSTSSDLLRGHRTDFISTSFASSATDFIGLRIGGEAVAFATGHRAGLSRTVAGADVTLSLGAATGAASFDRDGQGSPLRISGTWPGATAGTFSAVGASPTRGGTTCAGASRAVTGR
jgi:hypothetical protein